jgi:hypothetical protein
MGLSLNPQSRGWTSIVVAGRPNSIQRLGVYSGLHWLRCRARLPQRSPGESSPELASGGRGCCRKLQSVCRRARFAGIGIGSPDVTRVTNRGPPVLFDHPGPTQDRDTGGSTQRNPRLISGRHRRHRDASRPFVNTKDFDNELWVPLARAEDSGPAQLVAGTRHDGSDDFRACNLGVRGNDAQTSLWPQAAVRWLVSAAQTCDH